MAVIQDLPQELLDRIIELTADPANSGRRSTSGWERRLPLVARSWLEPGQRLAYSSVQLITSYGVEKPLRSVIARRARTTRPLRIHQLYSSTEDYASLQYLVGKGQVEADMLFLVGYTETFPWEVLSLISELSLSRRFAAIDSN